MCYHRRLHFIACNHMYTLNNSIMRFCPRALAGPSGLVPCARVMAHPCTTYKVARVCPVCEGKRRQQEGTLERLRKELAEVRARLEKIVEEEREGMMRGAKVEGVSLEVELGGLLDEIEGLSGEEGEK